MRADVRRSNSAPLIRAAGLLLVWLLMTTVAYLHQKTGGGPEGAPTVDALCPMGGIATLYKVAASGEYLQRTYPSAIILFGGTIVLAVLFRRAFCGYICPLGAMQEVSAWVGRRMGWHRPLLHNRLDGYLRWLKYPVLLVILGFTYSTGELVFRTYDPWASYAHVSAGWGELHEEFLIGTVILVLSLVGGVIIDRPWCRYLCPLGALLAPVSKIGLVRIVRRDHTCIHCHKCDSVCPVDIAVEAVDEVSTGECIACGKCVVACPVPGTLQFRARTSSLSATSFGLLSVMVFFGIVGFTHLNGAWRSQPHSLTEITGVGDTLDATNIRGFMSLDEIGAAYGVDASALIERLQLPANTDTQQPVKDVMKPLERDVEEIREAIRNSMQSGDDAGSSAQDTPASTGPPAITGQMSFAEIGQAAGIGVGALIGELGLPTDAPRDVPVKDIMRPLGRDVDEVRRAVTAMRTNAASEAVDDEQNRE